MSANSVDHQSPGSPLTSRGSSLTAAQWSGPLVLVAAAAASALFRPEATAADLVWVFALVINGMPHGAFDVAVVRDQARTSGGHAAATTALLYTLITAIAAACFVLWPSATVMMFLVLSAHHFGVSDCVWTRGRAVKSLSGHVIGLSHGVVVLTVPFIVAPSDAWSPFIKIAQAAGGTFDFDPSFTRSAAATLLTLAVMVQLVVSVHRRADPPVIEQAGVLVGATLLGLVAPPLLAIGVYFLVVHALGHCVRADARYRQARSPGLMNALRVHWQAAPLSIPSIGIVGIIAATVFGNIAPSSVTSAFLLFCVVGTLPHHLLWLSTFGALRSDLPPET